MSEKILIGRDYLPAILELVKQARQSIYIIIFDWRFYPEYRNNEEGAFNKAIIQAKARGVDIKVIANNDIIKDRLTALGIKCKRIALYKMIHAKLILIDETTAVIGSHNLTQSAFQKNLEISAIITDQNACKQLTGYFLTLWG
jgi:phosphatidylserine/phosphatidylglycerophosphate/cardiolipin synthase-like enzyme